MRSERSNTWHKGALQQDGFDYTNFHITILFCHSISWYIAGHQNWDEYIVEHYILCCILNTLFLFHLSLWNIVKAAADEGKIELKQVAIQSEDRQNFTRVLLYSLNSDLTLWSFALYRMLIKKKYNFQSVPHPIFSTMSSWKLKQELTASFR